MLSASFFPLKCSRKLKRCLSQDSNAGWAWLSLWQRNDTLQIDWSSYMVNSRPSCYTPHTNNFICTPLGYFVDAQCPCSYFPSNIITPITIICKHKPDHDRMQDSHVVQQYRGRSTTSTGTYIHSTTTTTHRRKSRLRCHHHHTHCTMSPTSTHPTWAPVPTIWEHAYFQQQHYCNDDCYETAI